MLVCACFIKQWKSFSNGVVKYFFSMNFNQTYNDQQIPQQQPVQQIQSGTVPQTTQWNSINQGAILDQNAIPGGNIDDIPPAASTSTSYNQKTSERMRVDEGNLLIFH